MHKQQNKLGPNLCQTQGQPKIKIKLGKPPTQPRLSWVRHENDSAYTLHQPLPATNHRNSMSATSQLLPDFDQT